MTVFRVAAGARAGKSERRPIGSSAPRLGGAPHGFVDSLGRGGSAAALVALSARRRQAHRRRGRRRGERCRRPTSAFSRGSCSRRSRGSTASREPAPRPGRTHRTRSRHLVLGHVKVPPLSAAPGPDPRSPRLAALTISGTIPTARNRRSSCAVARKIPHREPRRALSRSTSSCSSSLYDWRGKLVTDRLGPCSSAVM